MIRQCTASEEESRYAAVQWVENKRDKPKAPERLGLGSSDRANSLVFCGFLRSVARVHRVVVNRVAIIVASTTFDSKTG